MENFYIKLIRLISFMLFSCLLLFNNVMSQCPNNDCLGYYELNNPNAKIGHNHETGNCTGYAFSFSNSDIGTPYGSREDIYIDQAYVTNYWRTWGFYEKVTGSIQVDDIAIWWSETPYGLDTTLVNHAAIVISTNPLKVRYMIGNTGPFEEFIPEAYPGGYPYLYVRQIKNTYGCRQR